LRTNEIDRPRVDKQPVARERREPITPRAIESLTPARDAAIN
jgi:hypothetical protein